MWPHGTVHVHVYYFYFRLAIGLLAIGGNFWWENKIGGPIENKVGYFLNKLKKRSTNSTVCGTLPGMYTTILRTHMY
jgi:hypothetical protein